MELLEEIALPIQSHDEPKTMARRIVKDQGELNTLRVQYKKREYTCKPDAKKEIEMLIEKKRAKIQYQWLTSKSFRKKGGARPSQE